MSYTLSMAGRPKEAIEYVNKGKRLDPLNPSRYLYLLGLAQFCMGELAEAAASVERALRLNPEDESIAAELAVFYGLLGREKEARAIFETVREKVFGNTDFFLSGRMQAIPFKDRAVAVRYAEGLFKAGAPGAISGLFLSAYKDNQLTGEQIKALLVGSTITGINYSIGPWWIEFKKNGEFTWRGATRSDSGKSRIEGDMICTQYQKNWWGLESCSTVFKNPSGTNEGKNEYFFVNDSTYFRAFSPAR
jgi:tetratricopeptide (TPR) repeat protein